MQGGGHGETCVYQVTIEARSGQPVDPAAIIAAIGSVPGVLDVQIVPVPSETLLEAPDPRKIDIDDLLDGYHDQSVPFAAALRSRTSNILRSIGISTVGDLLALGSAARIEGIGRPIKAKLAAALMASGFEWKPSPGMSDWVQLYDSFGDMPIVALHTRLDYRALFALRGVKTVREVLAMKESELAGMFAGQHLYHIRATPTQFLVDVRRLEAVFEQEKARLDA